MGLSRLNNFLKSSRGTILYVDPNSFDSTDSIENSGNSLTRPFKTIQRALIEAARFSYQRGLSNDRFNKTTILLYPGDHLVDNRPGYIPTGAGTYSARSGETGLADLTEWAAETNLDLTSPSNSLYKLNSIHGGVIVPRGTSIVALDLRKTKLRPTYVPDPENDNIEESCVFRVTGSCYFWQFSVFDADPNGNCYKNYNPNLFVPNFSHHKLRVFEYADGVNPVNINDPFLTYSTSRTDLDMYYEKVAAVYGPYSGREILPDYGIGAVDIQPLIDEYRIVGPKGRSVGITSIFAGNGVVSSTTITVNVSEAIEGLSVDSPIQISGVGASGYDGQYVIATAPSATQITYKVQNPPLDPLPSFAGSSLSLVVDSVTSSSPYIFNISLRSAWGMCGLLADGDKATGFKSMVVAQFTGIGLQKDENAFVKYDENTGTYKDSNDIKNLHTNSRSRFKPSHENYHIKATNDAFLQLVSVFAIGYANHIVTENGGDIALNNSNSNFGAKALISSGFKRDSFAQDDYGYITHIIPPREIESNQISVEFLSLDVGVTTQKSAGAATTDRLYLYNQTNRDKPPTAIINGYHVGAKKNETLNLQIYQNDALTTYSSNVVMPSGNGNLNTYSSEKISIVNKSAAGINSITANLITLTEPHAFTTGESVRVISDNAHLPDGISPNQLYYISLVGITTNNQIYLSKTLNSSIAGIPIALNNKGGTLSIVSRVSDKTVGDIGHPVQWDGGQWYIGVSTSNNQIYNAINAFGVGSLGEATTRAYVTRKPDSRSLIDTLYRVRYVLPKDSQGPARPPVDGYILQESSNILGSGQSEISQLYNSSGLLSNYTQLRNPRFIANATWSSNVATITTEIPHLLNVGDEVKIENVLPSVYNGTYIVTSVPNLKQFRYSLVTSTPSSFANNTSDRSDSLPYFIRKKYSKVYQIYRTQEVQPYVKNVQDGVYYLTLINHSNKPTVSPFTDKGFSQPVTNLYPQTNNDNPSSDPDASSCHALPDQIGTVVVDDLQNSITKETLESFVVGFGITNIRSSSGTSHTIYTRTDHGLSGITSVSIVSAGTAYGTGSGSPAEYYNARLVGFAGSTVGSNATAKVTIDGSGQIVDVKIIDGGSAYGIGNTVSVVGIATTTGHVVGVLKVETINNNVNDTLRVFGISSSGNSGYNTVYRVSEIGIGKSTEINVVSTETISGFSTLGLGVTLTANSKYVLSGKAIQVSTFNYSSTTGLATIGFSTSHGLSVNQKIRIEGANESVFNGDFIVKKLNSKISLIANLGVTTTSTTATGTIFVHTPPLTSYGGDLISDSENISGRLIYDYDGVTTFLNSEIPSSATNPVSIEVKDAILNGLDLGDYLLIDNEIFRIKDSVSSDSIVVFRSTLGSPVQTHDTGSVVRRIRISPVEFRRNSIIRASAHTFEYLGFGPGNYSTALPEKQDRVLTTSEKFLSQSIKSDGGIIVYTGMNSDGDFFAGNKKINSATGKEETFDTPFPTTTGEKDINSIVNVTETQKLFVSNSIRVEGGKDKNTVSEFDGPVIFENKVTSNSDIEANNILIQGNQTVSRRFSISDSRPSSVGNYGDIVFNSIPKIGKNVGWVYVTDNSWTEFGTISPLDTNSVGIFNKVAISTSSPGDSVLRIGAGSSLFEVDSSGGVGIATTANGYKLNVNGNLRANYLYGDGSNLTNLSIPSSGWTGITGGLYNTNLNKVGIGTTNPTQDLHVRGNVRITGGLYDSNNSVGSASSVLSSTGSGLSWVPNSCIVSVAVGTTNIFTEHTTNYASTGLTTSITPSSATNKILITVSIPTSIDQGSTAAGRKGINFIIRRSLSGITTLATFPYHYAVSGNSLPYINDTATFSYVDSPNTTNQVTYQIFGRSISSGTGLKVLSTANIGINTVTTGYSILLGETAGTIVSSITLTEIRGI